MAKSLLLTISCFIVVTSVFALTSAAGSETDVITVHASVDKPAAYIGDRVTYRIDVAMQSAEVEVEIPSSLEKIGVFEVKDARHKRSKGIFGKPSASGEYVLTTYEVGQHTIEPLTVRYRLKGQAWQEKKTEPLTIQIQSVLAEQKDADDIRDIKGPMDLGRNMFLFFASALALGAFIAYGVYVLAKKLWQEKERRIIKPAHTIAYEELEDIRMRDLPGQRKIKEYFSRLSDCIRRYLENRFYFRAPEMTTEEFLDSVKNSDLLTGSQRDMLKGFLSSCDMVKFAKYGPALEEVELSFQLAKRFVDETKEDQTNEKPKR